MYGVGWDIGGGDVGWHTEGPTDHAEVTIKHGTPEHYLHLNDRTYTKINLSSVMSGSGSVLIPRSICPV